MNPRWTTALLLTLGLTTSAPAQQDGGGAIKRVEVHRDIPYAATEDPAQRLDLLVPKKRGKKPLPIIAFVHGGAWRAGNKRSAVPRLARYVASGQYAAASIEYRLTDKAIWPAQIHDCKAAVRWLKANAAKYNLDAGRIVVWGSSAGGHLVAMLGVAGDVEKLEGDLGIHLDQSSEVQGVIDFYGPAEMLTMNEGGSRMDHYAPDSPESLLLGAPVKTVPDKAREASPVTHVSANDCAFLIMHGAKDPLVPFKQSEKLYAALKKAGVDATLVPVVNAGHGFGGPEVDARVMSFLERRLLGKDVTTSSEPINVRKRQRD